MQRILEPLSSSKSSIPAGAITIEADRKLGFIHVAGHGFWSVGDIRTHFCKLERLVRDMRNETPRVLALIDLTGAPVQSSETAEEIKLSTTRIYQGMDQIAIIQNSPLLAMQMRRVVDNDKCEIFRSVDQALAWLKIDPNSIERSIPQ